MTSEKDQQETGIVLIDKPLDWTSHDVVDCVRRRFGIRKVGHCGTLDPNATGLLILLLGRATKLSAYLSSQDKTYCGTMRLGQTTTTQDPQGEIVAETRTDNISPAAIRDACASCIGEIDQVPPMTSAKKHKGKPLYKLAHKGKEVSREPRRVSVYKFDVQEIDIPYVSFETECSKGTYVRTLCAEIGEKLGCGAHLHSLRRLRSGKFRIEDAYSMDTIKSWEREDILRAKMDLSEMPMYTS